MKLTLVLNEYQNNILSYSENIEVFEYDNNSNFKEDIREYIIDQDYEYIYNKCKADNKDILFVLMNESNNTAYSKIWLSEIYE